jgi:TolB-like protein/DNA-binding winged helix-turn-helix (wHTH) protein
MSNGSNRLYEFGPYRMHPVRNLLLRGSEPVPLTAKAFETLLVLIEHGDQVVSKEELMSRLWPDTFVEEANLAQHISMVRKALGETPQDRRYIITLPGRGYRFAERVRTVFEEEEGDAEAKYPAPSTSVVEQVMANSQNGALAPAPQSVHSSRAWVVSLLALFVLLLAGDIYLQRTRGRSRGVATQRVMLAVLPFANLSNDPAQEYFSDGLTEETITDLGELNPERLGVIARTSAMTYKHTAKTVSQIGRELGVDFILEGSVRQEGEKARVSAQLIRVRDQTHLWAQNYDRQLSDLLEIENELGNKIAQQVQVSLSPQRQIGPSKARAVDPQVYDLYLKGRYYWNQRTEENFWKELNSSDTPLKKIQAMRRHMWA